MAGISRCRLYRRSFVKISLVMIITITLINWSYFTIHFSPSSLHTEQRKLKPSNRTEEKKPLNDQNDDIKALVQLKNLKASKTNQHPDDTINKLKNSLMQHTRNDEMPSNSVVKESLNNVITNSDVSKGGTYQPTQIKELIEEYERQYRAKTGQSEDISDVINGVEYPTEINHKITDNYRCPNNTIAQESNLVSYGTCKPHQAPPEACKEARRLFYLDPPKCENPYRGDICSLTVLLKNKIKVLKAHCSRKLCREGRHSLIVKSLNPATGRHDIIHKYNSIKELEKSLPLVVKQNNRNDYNYVFIQCKGRRRQVVQLLTLDPRFTIKESRTRRHEHLLNVNIILVDSVSRAHFYRSLPKTINLFKRWTNDRTHSPARVFDFELFQAVEGHTAENTHALFTGELFPPSINRDDSPAVGMEKLFGHYKRCGYQTIWQEDLCWEGQWGLFVDLALPFDWNNLAPKLKNVFIDHTGITHSSCEVLQTYGLTTPFNGPTGHKICYNGKFQHSYFLKYNQETLQAIASNPKALPILSYMTLSVGHDQFGRRIQSFDEALSQFVEQIAQDRSTISIVLADHGNTYTEYTATTQEGRFEMFHPSLFFIIPNEVAKKIGKNAIDSLTINQGRLVTMVDLHHSLMALAGAIPTTGVPPRGVFTPISLNRTCDSVDLRTPNLCVCDGWDSPTTNDTLKLAIVEFALGQLNNRLQQGDLPLTRSCSRLQAIGFSNVRQRNSKADGSLITSLDIMVPSGEVVSHKQDTFRVEVKTNVSPSKTSLDMELVHYERLSMFGAYRVCADNDVNIKLCVCSKKKQTTQKMSKEKLEKLMRKKTSYFVNSKVTFTSIDEEGCLTLIERVHGQRDAYAYELANTCLHQSYTVVLEMTDMYNIKVSRDGPIETKLVPGSVIFVFSARKSLSYYNAHIFVQVTSIE